MRHGADASISVIAVWWFTIWIHNVIRAADVEAIVVSIRRVFRQRVAVLVLTGAWKLERYGASFRVSVVTVLTTATWRRVTIAVFISRFVNAQIGYVVAGVLGTVDAVIAVRRRSWAATSTRIANLSTIAENAVVALFIDRSMKTLVGGQVARIDRAGHAIVAVRCFAVLATRFGVAGLGSIAEDSVVTVLIVGADGSVGVRVRIAVTAGTGRASRTAIVVAVEQPISIIVCSVLALAGLVALEFLVAIRGARAESDGER